MDAKRHDRNTVNKIFGTELPQASSDERDPNGGGEDSDRDDWLRDNVPPHHH